MCSDCEAYGLKKHGLTRPDCIRTSNFGTIEHYIWCKIIFSSDDNRLDSHQMDIKSLIQGMLSPSKADLWVVMMYTNYLVAGMNLVKCVCKMEKDH